MSKPRVLIADDSAFMRGSIARLLGASGFEIIGQAKDGKDAVDKVLQLGPDVVTMDLTMTEMDGVECISQLLLLFPKINILVVSALSDKSTAIAALKLGARGFVAKPFSDDELKMALLDVMEAR